MSVTARSPVALAVALSLVSPLLVSHALAADVAPGTIVTKDEDALPEITVTAQFISTNIQDTPIAITAVTAEMLEARGQTRIEEVANQAPNVTLKAQGASMGPSLIGFIRGVGQTDFNPALEPGVGLYVDDVYYSTLTGSVLDLLDLERVEILRGPQGTLAGKNSIGGSIKMFSKKPTGDGGGYVEAGYGSLDEVSVRGAADFALVDDKLFARIAGVSRSRDGYVDRIDYGCSHPGSGVPVVSTRGGTCKLGTEGGIAYTAGRLSLRWIATDSLEVNFAADVTRDRSDVPANILMNVGPTLLSVGIDTDNNINTGYFANVGTIVQVPIPTGYDLLWTAPGAAGACRYIAYGPASCDPNSPNDPHINYSTYMDPRVAGSGTITASAWTPVSVPPEVTLDARGMSANIDWQITSDLQLQSITAWRTYESSFSDDADGTPLPLQLLLQHLHHEQRSQELRLNGKIGSWLDYTVGGFYFDQDTNEDARVDIPYAALDFLHGPDLVPATTWAIFGHGIINFTDRMHLALGIRYTDEKKDYTYARHNPDGTPIPSPCGPPSLNCALTGLNGLSGHFADTRYDYRAAFSYDFTDNFMGYAQYTTGYKGGGINPRPFYPAQVLSFNPETIDAYEVGLKSQLFDRTLRLNAAFFWNQYKDMQIGINDCTAYTGPPGNPFGVPCIYPANAGDADVKGGELEANWYPIEGLEIDAAVSFLNFDYTNLAPATGIPEDGITPYTPETKWSLGAQYRFAFAGGSSITPRIDVTYQSDIYGNPLNSVTSKIDAYTLLNARLTWNSPDDVWQVALEGQNLTDELYFVTKFDLLAAAGGFQSGQPGLPRTVMLKFKRSF